MTSYAYLHKDDATAEMLTSKTTLNNYADQNNIQIDEFIEERDSLKAHWTNRKIGEVLQSLRPGDTIIVIDATQLACSTSQVLEILSSIHRSGAQIHFTNYQASMQNQNNQINTQHILSLVGRIESDFISKRTMQALAKRRAAGLPLGRPKGRGNKSLKLDKHREDIQKYLGLGISKASIAKLVGCHPQTLYDWLDRNNINADHIAQQEQSNSK